ncbi:unspecified product [Leishmania tarentolae]|uniref:Unspecified product n=1 Tax=Leishmania tarentolae TaxID=5689 RepID=A0A640KGZ5_LEITA|nr:unspecified product [Leishmania tarentolae]
MSPADAAPLSGGDSCNPLQRSEVSAMWRCWRRRWGSGWRCVGATCDSVHSCTVHMMGSVPAVLERTPHPALALPTCVRSECHPEWDAPGVATGAVGAAVRQPARCVRCAELEAEAVLS